jgi:hypothetical protein
MSEILTKEFSLGDVLSITTGRLVSERHMDGVYDILNWMTGDNLFTHVLPRAGRACEPILKAQFPQLNPDDNPELMRAVVELVQSLDMPGDRDRRIADWLWRLKQQYGDSFDVVPLREWESRSPLTELEEMVGPDKVIAIQAPESEDFPKAI